MNGNEWESLGAVNGPRSLPLSWESARFLTALVVFGLPEVLDVNLISSCAARFFCRFNLIRLKFGRKWGKKFLKIF